MFTPKISVVMSVYNSEKFLDAAIKSILEQSFKNFEFIIINDGSTDNSSEIIKKYIENDKKIVLINNKKNLGRAKSRNEGLKIARGKYVAILDSDDIALPERLGEQYNFLGKNREFFLVGSSAYNIDEQGGILTTHKSISNPSKVVNKLARRNCIYHSSVMYKNSKKYFYREKFPYSQDYDFYLRLLSDNKKLTNLKKPLIKYRINPEAISFSQRTKQKLFAEKAREFYHQRLKYGKDEYDKFDPNEILSINAETSTNKVVLESEIKAGFKLNNFKRVRKLCKKYFRHYGFLKNITVYYLFSFMGKRFVNMIRKVLFS